MGELPLTCLYTCRNPDCRKRTWNVYWRDPEAERNIGRNHRPYCDKRYEAAYMRAQRDKWHGEHSPNVEDRW